MLMSSFDSNGFARGRSDNSTEGKCVCLQCRSHLQPLSSACNRSPRDEVRVQELCHQLRAECVTAERSSEGILRRMEIQKHKLRLILCHLEGFSESTRIEERVGFSKLPLEEGYKEQVLRNDHKPFMLLLWPRTCWWICSWSSIA